MSALKNCLTILFASAIVGCGPPGASPPGNVTAIGTVKHTGPPTELEGSYTFKSEIRDGKPTPPERFAEVRQVHFFGDTISFLTGQSRQDITEFRLDWKQRPAHIDFVKYGGLGPGGKGIFKVVGNELIIAFNELGNRPTDFEPKEGKTIHVLIREAKK